jgi:adenylate cyclase
MSTELEIERRWICSYEEAEHACSYGERVSEVSIRQGYLARNPLNSVRIRGETEGGEHRYELTVKGPADDDVGNFECNLPLKGADWTALWHRCVGKVYKFRTKLVGPDGLVWDIDMFMKKHKGLVIAEVELPSTDHPVVVWPWARTEITHMEGMTNGSIATCEGRHPIMDLVIE